MSYIKGSCVKNIAKIANAVHCPVTQDFISIFVRTAPYLVQDIKGLLLHHFVKSWELGFLGKLQPIKKKSFQPYVGVLTKPLDACSPETTFKIFNDENSP